MRILVVTSAAPRADANTMGSQQIFHRLRKLTHEHEFIVAFAHPDPDAQAPTHNFPFQLVRLPTPVRRPPLAVKARPRLYWQIHGWYRALIAPKPMVYQECRDRELPAAISELIRQHAPDIVHMYGEPMLYNLSGAPPNLLADFPDLYSILFERTEQDILRRRTYRWQHACEIEKIKRVEKEIISRAAAALFVSETDRAVALQLAPTARTFIVPIAVDIDFFDVEAAEDENLIVFTGTLSYGPNVRGLEFFVREIFPHICAAVPDTHFDIVGYEPGPAILAMQNEHIRVHANVRDIRPYLGRAAISVIPLLSGSGVRNKIIEAWAMRKAVVSTRIGAEGLDAQDGTHLLLRDDAKLFADAVIELLRDAARRRALGEAGYRLAAARYSMTRAAQELNSVYHTVARDSS